MDGFHALGFPLPQMLFARVQDATLVSAREVLGGGGEIPQRSQVLPTNAITLWSKPSQSWIWRGDGHSLRLNLGARNVNLMPFC